MNKEFMVGTNFSQEQLNFIIMHKIKIKEVYGSLQSNQKNLNFILPTARTNLRLPDINQDDLKKFISSLHKHDIKFNYTLNASNTAIWYNMNENDFYNIFDLLLSLRIDNITLSHPLPLFYFQKYFSSTNCDVNVELSTILNLSNLNAIDFYLTKYPFIKKICISIYKNRDFNFLTKAQEIAKQHGAEIELLVNEFCNIVGIPCDQFYRSSCYDLNSIDHAQLRKHENYPKTWCTAARKNEVAWIKAPFISPLDTDYYTEKTGITKFKVAGRTYNSNLWRHTLNTYLINSAGYIDNLFSLWGHVAEKNYRYYFSLKKLKNAEFIENFPDGDCYSRLCKECQYCHKILNKIYEK